MGGFFFSRVLNRLLFDIFTIVLLQIREVFFVFAIVLLRIKEVGSK